MNAKLFLSFRQKLNRQLKWVRTQIAVMTQTEISCTTTVHIYRTDIDINVRYALHTYDQ